MAAVDLLPCWAPAPGAGPFTFPLPPPLACRATHAATRNSSRQVHMRRQQGCLKARVLACGCCARAGGMCSAAGGCRAACWPPRAHVPSPVLPPSLQQSISAGTMKSLGTAVSGSSCCAACYGCAFLACPHRLNLKTAAPRSAALPLRLKLPSCYTPLHPVLHPAHSAHQTTEKATNTGTLWAAPKTRARAAPPG